MWKIALAGSLLLRVIANGQSELKEPRKVLGPVKPECAQRAICFSGEVREGQVFRKNLNADLEFVISLPGGFQVEITEADNGCKRLFWLADPPFHAHRQTEIDAAYDWTAEQEVETSPRDFRFATTCSAYHTLSDLDRTDEFVREFNAFANGQGRLWITDSKVTHSHGINNKEQGAVEWIRFSVEIKLPDSY